MIKRILVVENGTYLHRAHRQLVVMRDGQRVGQVPFEDLGVLMLDHPAIVLTQAVLSACQEAGAVVIVSDGRHLPAALLLPLSGHSLHARILEAQVNIGLPTRKRLWQTLIQAKINAQALNLEADFPESASHLRGMVKRVRSGDPDNLEAQAAQHYWPALFGNSFRRGDSSQAINGALNFGYALLRSAVARALVGSGLHPAVGLHHHNQYDDFRLADDLMEPLRPLVDRHVRQLDQKMGGVPELNPGLKHELLRMLEAELRLGGRQTSLFAALSAYTASLVAVALGKGKVLEIPVP
ncbi:MAG: hypothetical protein A2286_08520 [Gammaproteobacteria bacterium RIFOXYA12_FULL_61_12]|nr:MAG: hypothetical protein A2514_08975 [Gammaproteobacteria bacterium RIFOXYD12_FULL_61_37]OGT94184.1 MAG: hypothetical protein A2286_08520 [Gammaproteobacteria bacterium RIFOXYA12_FULL_61_12]